MLKLPPHTCIWYIMGVYDILLASVLFESIVWTTLIVAILYKMLGCFNP